MSTILILINFIAMAWLVSGCTGLKQEHRPDHTRQLVEDKTLPFNPSYFTTPGHRAITFDIENGELELPDNRRIENRPGPLPYRPPGAGDVVVVYKDQNGRELGRSIIEDPTQIRFCDTDKGGKLGERKLRQKGKYDLLLPADNRIVELEIVHMAERFSLKDHLKQERRPSIKE